MLISIRNDLPGHQATFVLGEVLCLTVRSRNVGSQFGATFEPIVVELIG